MFEHDYSVQDKVMRVCDSITHQGIGGQLITLEFGLSKEEVLSLAAEGNWANLNFLKRRINDSLSPQEIIHMAQEIDINDSILDFLNSKLYYGKVNGLGYIVSEDELKEVV